MTLRTHSLLAAAACAAWPAAPATAGTPARIFEAGRCIVQHDRRAAIALLRTLPLDGSAADLSALGACAAGAESASAMLLRGAIAQALFQRDFRGTVGHEPRPGQDPVDLGLPGIAAAPESYRWADCVVRNDPPATERLLRTAVGSPQESAAVSELQPYMSACMALGAEISVRPSEMRSLFAQGAYQTSYRYWTGQLNDAD